jgi:uncharacterized protein (TIGR00369 family)
MTTPVDPQTLKNPNYADLVQERFSLQTPMHLIGASLGQVEPGYVEVVLPIVEKVWTLSIAPIVHGGVLGMIADTSMGMAALTLAEPGAVGVTAEYKISYIAPAAGDEVIACGKVIKSGRRATIASSELYAVKDGARTLVALATSTFIPTGVRSPAENGSN